MKLLVIVLCLLSERFLIHSISLQRFSWFGAYYQTIKKLMDKNNANGNPWLIFAAVVLPVVVLSFLIYFLFHGMIFGIIGLTLNILIFLYCLGPANPFYPIYSDDASEDDVGHYLAQVNTQLFAAIFWYILAGPVVLIAYRVITLARNINEVSPQANELTNILEWLPARLTALLYMLVGNFQRGLTHFTKLFIAKPEFNQQMLSECGLLSVRANDSDSALIGEAESLVEHATLILLVFIAVFTLIAWL